VVFPIPLFDVMSPSAQRSRRPKSKIIYRSSKKRKRNSFHLPIDEDTSLTRVKRKRKQRSVTDTDNTANSTPDDDNNTITNMEPPSPPPPPPPPLPPKVEYRMEHDLIGDEQVPKDAYYGIQTQRA
jgi:hypothetical protein